MSKYLSARTVASDEDVIKAKKMKSIRDFTSQLKREVENLQNQHVRDQESFLEDLKRKQEVEMETLKMKHNQMLLDATGVEEDAISVKTRISREHVLKGTGGGYQVKIFFLRLNICSNPGYLVFKMGSLAFQLQMVVEI